MLPHPLDAAWPAAQALAQEEMGVANDVGRVGDAPTKSLHATKTSTKISRTPKTIQQDQCEGRAAAHVCTTAAVAEVSVVRFAFICCAVCC